MRENGSMYLDVVCSIEAIISKLNLRSKICALESSYKLKQKFRKTNERKELKETTDMR